MIPIFRDYETRSPNPIRWGVDNYFAKGQPLILTYAIGDAPVQLVDYSEQITFRGTKSIWALPYEFHDPQHLLVAHNNQFDRRVEERLFKFFAPMERYRCTQAQAYAHGLPGSLEMLGQVLGITLQKLTGDDGHKLMLFFCTPRSFLKDGTPVWGVQWQPIGGKPAKAAPPIPDVPPPAADPEEPPADPGPELVVT